MEQAVEFPEYVPGRGVVLEWDPGYELAVHVDPDGAVVIGGNAAGLASLARHLLTLAQAGVPAGAHVHLSGDDSLDSGSGELILERR